MPARTVFISGGSRGIGLAIAIKLARSEGANVVIAAKTATPHPTLPGTIYTAAEEIEKAGGKALPVVMDVRSEESVRSAIDETVKKFGGLDVMINNASAISLTGTQQTKMKTFDLMSSINSRGTYLASALAIPHLLKSTNNPHILTLSPPLKGNLTPEILGSAPAYALAKFGMSFLAVALAGELKGKVGSNALWPFSLIDTEALRLVKKGAGGNARSPQYVAEAAAGMLAQDGKSYSGNIELDELFLRRKLGWKNADMDKYAPCKMDELAEDLFIPEWVREEIAEGRRQG